MPATERADPLPPPRVGLLGGSFDPVHLGHLIAAEATLTALGLDRILFVPAADPPHKQGMRMSAAHHRLAMLELAIADNPRFAISRIDLDRPGPHFTVELLRLARKELGLSATDPLWFVMGGDSLVDLPTWRDPRGIVAQARLAVVGRPGHAADVTELEGLIPGLGADIDFVAAPLIGISGSDVRDRVARGRSIRYHVPAAVEAYVRRHALYGA